MANSFTSENEVMFSCSPLAYSNSSSRMLRSNHIIFREPLIGILGG